MFHPIFSDTSEERKRERKGEVGKKGREKTWKEGRWEESKKLRKQE